MEIENSEADYKEGEGICLLDLEDKSDCEFNKKSVVEDKLDSKSNKKTGFHSLVDKLNKEQNNTQIKNTYGNNN